MKETKPKTKRQGPGRPEVKIKLGKAPANPGTRKRRFKLSDHRDINRFALVCLEDQIADADDLINYTRSKRDQLAATAIGEVSANHMRCLETAEREYRQSVKDRRQLWLSLVKELELLQQLARPAEDNPLYTPVHIHLSPPPASSIASRDFQMPEDDRARREGKAPVDCDPPDSD